jgi:restriction endonuclease Mrr
MAKAMGAVEVKRVPRRSDQGADVIADFQLMGGLLVTVGIQAKFYQPGKHKHMGHMGKEAVKQLADALQAGVAEMGLVITTGDVSEEAYRAAEEYLSRENLQISILGGRELAELIVDKGLWSAFDF